MVKEMNLEPLWGFRKTGNMRASWCKHPKRDIVNSKTRCFVDKRDCGDARVGVEAHEATNAAAISIAPSYALAIRMDLPPADTHSGIGIIAGPIYGQHH